VYVIEEYECDPSVDLDNCDKDFNISFQLLWEMVKMKIRGSAISLTSYKKKQQNKSLLIIGSVLEYNFL
jgi:hypothetical protein